MSPLIEDIAAVSMEIEVATWQKMPEVNKKKGNAVREYAAIVARVAVT